jgi:disease resistance protein RPM1
MYVMATTASKAIMGVLAEKLKALLGREYDLQVGVHDDVKSLQSELEFMHAFLQDYDYASYRHYLQQTTTSAQDKVWVRKVRELAYHVEDAIDDFTCRVGPAPKEIPDMVKHFVYTLMARHQIAKQLRRLRLEAQELSEQRARYPPLGTPPSSTTTVQLQWQLPPPPDETTSTNLLVGIDGPRDEFIANLTSAARKHGSGRRRVASMVGIAGVGKTTLAKAVYHSLEDSFQCRAFVTVSRKPDPRRVLKDILQQVMITTGSGSSPAIASMETWEDSQFVDRLRDNLKDKRFDSGSPPSLAVPILFFYDRVSVDV